MIHSGSRLERKEASTTMVRTLVSAQVSALGDDEVEVCMSTASLARDGHILVPQGCILDNYRANPIWLWQHDPEHPIGTACNVQIRNNAITARVRFAPLGISKKADEIRGLVKSGVVRGVSVGFEPLDGVALDPKRPYGGMRFTSWELLECSFCSIPVDTEATVTARAQSTARNRKQTSTRNMDAITKAQLAATTAQDEHQAGARHHAAIAESVERLDEHRRQVRTHLRAFQQALEAGNKPQAQECHARCRRSLQGVERELRAIGDRHLDATDAHQALSRSMNDSWAALGADSGSVPSKGSVDSEPQLDVAGPSHEQRKRHAEALELATVPITDEQRRRQRQAEALALAHPPD